MKILGIPCHPLKMAVINFVNLAAFYLSGTAVTNKKVLKSLKDKYTGKRCFIVCNGPSLRPEDLTKIHESGDISIAMNMIGRVYKDTPWRETFLSATDDCAFLKKNKKIVRETECDLKFYDERRYLLSLSAIGKKAYLAFNESLDLLDHPVFDSDITKKMPSIGTSTYVCLEFAVYLGCREIYLIGCDMSYKVNLNRDGSVTYNDAGKDHFYKSEEEAVETTGLKPNPTWQMKAAYDAAANAAKVQGFKIYNATRGGMLESFPRVDFDSLF